MSNVPDPTTSDTIYEGLSASLNSDYTRAENILTDKDIDKNIDVLVEDEEDIRFWNYVLTTIAPDYTFNISPYQYGSLNKGKSNVLKDVAQFGSNKIGCVDSDYDYLLPAESPYAEALRNPYVIQTGTYSFENYVCDPTTLGEVCFQATTRRTDFDFIGYMTQLSRLLYPVLLWVLYFQKNGYPNNYSANSIWEEALPHSTDININYLDKVRCKTLSLLQQFQTSCPAVQPLVDALGSSLPMLTPENAWWFVRGHNLVDYIHDVVVKPLCDNELKTVNQQISLSASDQGQKDSIPQHIKNIRRNPREVLLDNFRGVTTHPLFGQIRASVQQALSIS